MRRAILFVLFLLFLPIVFASSETVTIRLDGDGVADGNVWDADGLFQRESEQTIYVGRLTEQVYRSFFDFNVSSIPGGSTVSSVVLNLTVDSFTGAGANTQAVRVLGLSNSASSLGASSAFSECGGGGSGTELVASNSSWDTAGAFALVNLTSAGITLLESRLGGGVFGVCLQSLDEVTDNEIKHFRTSEFGVANSSGWPELIVTYETSPLNTSNVSLFLNGVESNLNITYNASLNVSGSGVNVSSLTLYRNGTNVTSELNTSIILGVGYYNYTLTGLGNDGADNSSVSLFVNVSFGEPNLTIGAPSSPVSFDPDLIHSVQGNGCPSELECNLYRNGTLISNETNTHRDLTVLPAGEWLYSFNTTGNDNYTEFEINSTFVVEKIDPPITLVYYEQERSFGNTTHPVKGATCPAELVCLLYRNSTQVANISDSYEDTNIVGVGSYNYTFNTSGNQNYSGLNASQIVNITKAPAPIQLHLGEAQGNQTITAGTLTIIANATNITLDSIFYNFTSTLYINNIESNLTNTTTFSAGTYNITLNTTGVDNNYTNNELNYTLTVQAASSGGGGGGGGGISTPPPTTEEPQECFSSWACNSWSSCQNGVQTRTCFDANACQTQTSSPVETQSCNEEPQEQSETLATTPNIFGEANPSGKGDGLRDIVVLECDQDVECRTFDELIERWEKINISGKVKFSKELVFDQERNITRAELFIEADEDLDDFQYYQSIPDCMAEYVRLVNFTTSQPSRVVNDDPLVVWEFASVPRGEVLDFSFEVEGIVDEDCLRFLQEIFFENDPLPSFANNSKFWISIVLLLGIIMGVGYAFAPRLPEYPSKKQVKRK